MVDRSLQDTASVSVSGNFDQVGSDGVVDELVVVWDELVETFLNNMVPVQILDQSDNVHAEGVDQGSDLLLLSRLSKEVDHLLNSSSTVHVQTDANEISSNRFDDGGSLLLGRVLEKLLTEVVAEWIDHELREVTVRLVEDHISMSSLAFFQLLLQVSTTMLVLAEVQQLALQILDSNTRETVD